MSRAEIHRFTHALIRDRIRVLIDGDLKGRKLVMAQELLAFTFLGHDRQFGDCPLANSFDNRGQSE